jgi:hypothetical protein
MAEYVREPARVDRTLRESLQKFKEEFASSRVNEDDIVLRGPNTDYL